MVATHALNAAVASPANAAGTVAFHATCPLL